jgi:hypothetical protein
LAREFSSDLGDMLNLPWLEFWDIVRKIPYLDNGTLLSDPDHEILSRPKYVFSGAVPFADCKQKSLILLSYAIEHGIPIKLIASIENGGDEIHHVFPVVFHGGRWHNADATFPSNRYDAAKPMLTYAEELTP